MKTSTKIAVLLAGCVATFASAACRGSPASIHAKCEMNIAFKTGCDKVKEEVTQRLVGNSGWKDPHNGGTYRLEGFDADRSALQGLHTSGNGNYTDLFEFVFHSDDDEESCVVEACSESQVTSVLDFSTNYCNLRNLYCSKEENCHVVEHDLQYAEEYKSCGQRDMKKCLTTSSSIVSDVVE